MYSVADRTPVFCDYLSISFLWPLKHLFSVVNGTPVLDFSHPLSAACRRRKVVEAGVLELPHLWNDEKFQYRNSLLQTFLTRTIPWNDDETC